MMERVFTKTGFFLIAVGMGVFSSPLQAIRQPLVFDPGKSKEIQKALGVENFVNERVYDVGVAIIDENFGDPKNYAQDLPGIPVEVIEKYDEEFLKEHDLPTAANLYSTLEVPVVASGSQANIGHGLAVAQSVLGVIGNGTGIKFYFLNGKGPFGRAAATYYAEKLFRDKKIRTVVSAVATSLTGIGNGKGVVDQMTSDVLRDPGLTWFQAAGNDGDMTWAGKAKRISLSQYIQFRNDDKNGHCLRFKNSVPDNDVEILLLWDGRQKKLTDGALVDYDLQVVDARGNPVGESTKVLDEKGEIEEILPLKVKDGEVERGQPGTQIQTRDFNEGKTVAHKTTFAREKLKINIPTATNSGSYCIRVKAISDSARESDDLQVIIRSKPKNADKEIEHITSSIEFLDANHVNEMVSPSTAEGVISVGNLENYSSQATDAGGRVLPLAHIGLDKVYFQDGRSISGTSFSAPILAGVKLLLDIKYQIDRNQFMKLFSDEPGPVSLDYVRNNHFVGDKPVGKVILEKLFAGAPELKESDVRAYIYAGGLTVLTVPDYAPKYQKILPAFPTAQEIRHLDEYDYFVALKSVYDVQGNIVPQLFYYPRFHGNDTLPVGQLPWDDEMMTTPGVRKFTPRDFIILEKAMPFDVMKARQRPDYKLRTKGNREVPRKTLFQKLDIQILDSMFKA